jgi:hypothetical protein
MWVAERAWCRAALAPSRSLLGVVVGHMHYYLTGGLRSGGGGALAHAVARAVAATDEQPSVSRLCTAPPCACSITRPHPACRLALCELCMRATHGPAVLYPAIGGQRLLTTPLFLKNLLADWGIGRRVNLHAATGQDAFRAFGGRGRRLGAD